MPVIGGAPTVAVGERDAVIEPEEIGGLVLRRLVSTRTTRLRTRAAIPGGDLVRGLLDDLAFGIHLDRHNSIVAGDGEHRAQRGPTRLRGCICWRDHGIGTAHCPTASRTLGVDPYA